MKKVDILDIIAPSIFITIICFVIGLGLLSSLLIVFGQRDRWLTISDMNIIILAIIFLLGISFFFGIIIFLMILNKIQHGSWIIGESSQH